MFVIVAQCQILLNEYSITDLRFNKLFISLKLSKKKLSLIFDVAVFQQPFIHSRSQIYNENSMERVHTEIYIYQDKKLFRSI